MDKCYNEACRNYSEEGNVCLVSAKPCNKYLSEPLLKYGDEIEVRERDIDEWMKSEFVTHDGDVAICKHPHSDIEIIRWTKWQRPSLSLTWEDRDKIWGKWVKLKNKEHTEERQITHLHLASDDVPYVNGIGSFETLQRAWEFIDGTPIK